MASIISEIDPINRGDDSDIQLIIPTSLTSATFRFVVKNSVNLGAPILIDKKSLDPGAMDLVGTILTIHLTSQDTQLIPDVYYGELLADDSLKVQTVTRFAFEILATLIDTVN